MLRFVSTLVFLNKPYGVLSQFTPEGKWRALDEFVPVKGVYVAGRLDASQSGTMTSRSVVVAASNQAK